MPSIKLKNAIKGKKTIAYERKAALFAKKCDCCEIIFNMDKYCNDNLEPSELKGTFSSGAVAIDGRHLGNMFQATVCSFECAHKIFNGAWENIPEYKPYKKAKAHLVRVELGLTSLIKTEEELISEWESR